MEEVMTLLIVLNRPLMSHIMDSRCELRLGSSVEKDYLYSGSLKNHIKTRHSKLCKTLMDSILSLSLSLSVSLSLSLQKKSHI